MRLIIDVDDNDYELLNKTGITLDWNTAWHGKEKDREMTFALFNLVKALKKGTPYEERLQGDLISREALKKELAKNITIWTFNVSYDGILAEIIDNAPTVTKSLQGEWITHKVAFHLTCSFCGCNLRAIKREVFEGDYDYNFCPNCGAKMMR